MDDTLLFIPPCCVDSKLPRAVMQALLQGYQSHCRRCSRHGVVYASCDQRRGPIPSVVF